MTDSLEPGSPETTPAPYHPRLYAYLGDSVYEHHIRQKALQQCLDTHHQQLDVCHRYTTQRVNATYQAHLLDAITPNLSPLEQDWIRRGKNAALTSHKQAQQSVHRQASGFETLIGYLALHDPTRLKALFEQMDHALNQG